MLGQFALENVLGASNGCLVAHPSELVAVMPDSEPRMGSRVSES